MSTLILIRGLPGSGKSTLSKKLKTEYAGRPVYVFEADDYFSKSGSYEFDASKLNQAHKECFNNTVEKLKQEDAVVIVSNTFTTIKELTPYVELSKGTIIIEMSSQFKSIHDVPEETIAKMQQRFILKEQVTSKFKDVIYRFSNQVMND